ncbi:hypothetical protein ACE6H2_019205 [Prunus campanulata]
MLKNELLSYVKMWGRQPCRLNISQQLCCCFFSEREIFVVKTEESEILKTTTKPPLPDKDWYLYVKLKGMEENLCRLNISNLCKSSSGKAPRFETVFDDIRVSDDNYWIKIKRLEGISPQVQEAGRHMIVGSKLYRVRGEFDSRFSETHKIIDYESMGFKSTVECYDLTHDSTDEEFPFMRVCDKDAIPNLIDPRIILGGKIMLNLEHKIYVLAFHNYKERHFFKVFDPLHQSWKDLHDPPSYYSSSYDVHFACAHKLFFVKKNAGTYVFDTQKEKWSVLKSEVLNPEMFEVVAEFQGFLIAMSRHRKEFVAWKLDGNGVPHKYRVLHELRDVFCPFLYPGFCYLGHLDSDGRMWFVYSSKVYLRVAVFRVSVSEDSAGNVAISADLETAEYYNFKDYCRLRIYSAFVLCHHVNDNFKPKNLYGTIVPYYHHSHHHVT